MKTIKIISIHISIRRRKLNYKIVAILFHMFRDFKRFSVISSLMFLTFRTNVVGPTNLYSTPHH